MASGPITSWLIDGETMETVTDFILGGSKITEDGDCSHEIKKHLLLGRKAITNLDSILKGKDIITHRGQTHKCYYKEQRMSAMKSKAKEEWGQETSFRGSSNHGEPKCPRLPSFW